ncbi:Ig-like domain repeat protein [Streptomyces sp. NPDC126514]|uniref:Ig-like domain repeat protein n=1 Tax=Streptomyces sp. NPDC126514 TaxID=3155210 RepID=UPI00332A93E8
MPLLLLGLFSAEASASPGDLDSTFGDGGKVATSIPGKPYADVRDMTLQKDGKIVTVGSAAAPEAAPDTIMVARHQADGSLDTDTFGEDGFAFPLSGSSGATAVAMQDDKIVVAGFANRDIAVVRLTADGSLDAGFGTGGIVTTDISTEFGLADAVVVQPDGKIIVAGYSDNRVMMARYIGTGANAGELDSGFGDSGVVRFADSLVTEESKAHAMALQPDGKIVIAGCGWSTDECDTFVARFKTDGSADDQFAVPESNSRHGSTKFGFEGSEDYATGIAIQTDGKIITVGRGRNGHTQLARLMADGWSDEDGFGQNGTVDIQDYDSLAVTMQGDYIVTAGKKPGSPGSLLVARYKPDGSPDASFASNGVVTTSFGDQDSGATAVHIQDGKIVAAGPGRTPEQILLVRYRGNDTTVDLKIGSAQSDEDDPVAFDVTVTSDFSSVFGVPAGDIALVREINGVEEVIKRGTLDGGKVSITVEGGSLLVGNSQVKAVYGGSDLYEGSESASVPHLKKAHSEVSVVPTSSAPTIGQQVSFKITVSSDYEDRLGKPAGNVGLFDGDTQVGTWTELNGGTATIDWTASPRSHQLRAQYEGSPVYMGDESSAIPFDLGPAPVQGVLSAAPAQAKYGQTIAFLATVTSQWGTPSGVVKLLEDSTEVAAVKPLGSNGTASFDVSHLPPGPHEITAKYGDAGAGLFRTTSFSTTVTVDKVDVEVGLSATPNPAARGAKVTFTATVTGIEAFSPPTGTVKLVEAGQTIAESDDLGGGDVQFEVADLSPGTHDIQARYIPDEASVGVYAAGQSGVWTQTVDKTVTALGLSAEPSPVHADAQVALSAVLDQGHSATGNVTFTLTSGGSVVQEKALALSEGRATWTLEPGILQPATAYQVTASYPGDAQHTADASEPVSLQVLQALQIADAQMPVGIVDSAYPDSDGLTLTATGGQGSYTWTSADKPAWLALDSDTGTLTGTPTKDGQATFTVTVTDPFGGSDDATLTVNVVHPLKLLTTSADAVAGREFTTTLQASGGKAPYTWALATGTQSVPWLQLAPDGTLTGTPPRGTDAGDYPVTVEITDTDPDQRLSATLKVSVHEPGTVFVSTNNLPPAVVDTAYSYTLTAEGGTAPYKWAVTDGVLPEGLTLSADGILSGIPQKAGDGFSFAVTATDASEPALSGSAGLGLIIAAPPLQPDITTPTLAEATVGTAYEQPLTAEDGTAPYTWAVTDGALPDGLTLAPDTGAITGTPTTEGSTTFTVTATDSNTQTGSRTYTLVTAPASASPSTAPSPSSSASTAPQVSQIPKGAPNTGISPSASAACPSCRPR